MDDLKEKKPSTEEKISFDIFTVLGHDLKSPLNAVESYLDILRNRVLGDGLDAYTLILENAVARLGLMRELITDVVDWARIQQPVSSRAAAAIDLSKTARDVLGSHLTEAQERNIVIKADIEDGLFMKAVAKEIELIFRHLISNAIKYNRDNGSVFVTVKKENHQIAVQVTDTGIGLSEEEQARLFTEFTRIKNSKTQDIRGTGLGLAIVKKLAELYQGKVTLKSSPDVGSTFSVIFGDAVNL